MTHRNDLSGAVSGGSVVQARDVSGGIHIHPPAPRTVQAPWQVPAAPSRFVNRAAGFAQLDHALQRRDPGGAVVLVTGPPGVGKSALARAWLWARRDAFPDGVLYADLRDAADQVALYRAVTGFLRALGDDPDHPPPDLETASALLRSRTASRRLALLVDGASDAESIHPFLAGAGALTLVTSARRLTALVAAGADWVGVDPLTRPDAVTLLGQFAGTQRAESDPGATDRLAALCADLPLALCLVGARLATSRSLSVTHLIHILTEEGRLLEQLAVDGSTLMRDVIDDCYQQLPESAQRMYRALGALPLATFTPHSAAAAAALPVREARDLLDRLAETNMILEHGQESFGFYPLIAAHARDLLRQPWHARDARDARDANNRTTAWYLRAVINAAGTVRPYRRDVPDPPARRGVEPLTFTALADALDWLDREDENILALARVAQDPDTALALIGPLWALFAYRKKYPIWEEADTLALRCARAAGNRDQEARMLRRLGLLTRDLGRYREAETYLTDAAEIFQQLGDQHRAATARGTLGVVQLRQGLSAHAAETLTRVLDTHRQHGEQREAALILIDLADTHIELGAPDTAIEHLREAAHHFDASPDEGTRARLTLLLGRAHTHTGQYQAAEQEFAEALSSARRNGSTTRHIEALMYQGELAARSGHPDLARERLAEAAALRETGGIPRSGWLAAKISTLTQQLDATR